MSFSIGSIELITFVFFLIVTSGEAYFVGQATNPSYARLVQGLMLAVLGFITGSYYVIDLGVIVAIIGGADVVASKFPNLVPLLDPTLG